MKSDTVSSCKEEQTSTPSGCMQHFRSLEPVRLSTNSLSMLQHLLSLGLVLATCCCCLAQKIELRNDSGGFYGLQYGRRLNKAEINQILLANHQAHPLVKKSFRLRKYAVFSLLAGTHSILFPIQTDWARRQEHLWKFVGSGVGLIVLSIPLFRESKHKWHEAVGEYNRYVDPISMQKAQPSFHFGSTENGIGISMRF